MVHKYKLFSGLLFGSIWIQLCMGFVFTEIPALDKLNPILLLLTDAIFVMLGLWCTRSWRDILFTVSFFVIVLISKYCNHQPLFEMFNGVRDYIGLLMCAPIIRYILRSKYAEDFTERMDSLCWKFLYLQAICITWQFLRYGANDNGGGSFGWGGSGQVSTLIYLISFYLLSKRWDFSRSWFVNLKENKANFILLYPTFLNETKISFIYLLIYLLLLFPFDRKYVLRMCAAVPLLLVLFTGIFFIYLNATDADEDTVLSKEFFDDYLFGGEDPQQLIELALLVQEEEVDTDNLWVVDIPRFTKLFAVPDMLSTTGGGMLWGAGVGQFKGGTLVEQSKFARKYWYLMGGTMPTLFRILIDLGVIGTIWTIVNLLTILFTPNTSPFAAQIRLYLFAVWGLIMFYDQELTIVISVWFMFYIAMSGLQPAGLQRVKWKEPKPKARLRT